MENVTRHVKDIDAADRRAIEHLLGQSLRDNQQLIIQVVNVGDQAAAEKDSTPTDGQALPDWCNVYEGFSDDEISDLEKTILTRTDLTRTAE